MKQYKSIDYWNKGIFGSPIIAFDKLDGSNIRSEWNRKQSKNSNEGFNKYGTRRQLTSIQDEQWGNAVNLFMNKYSCQLNKIFREDKDFRNARTITVFVEYYGSNSFAGWHNPNDKMDVTLFDIDVFQKGILKPKDFIKKFEHLGIPDIIYEGNYNQSLIDNVRNNVYDLSEGVVCKGITKTKRKKIEQIHMSKIKTIEWLQKVKKKYGQDKLLEELNGDKSLMI